MSHRFSGRISVLFAGFFLSVVLVATVPASVWPVDREWTEEEETAFSKWVEKIGSKQWKSTNVMLHNKEYNTLWDAKDEHVYFYCDCADLPYVMRAYYAYKRHLPFTGNYVSGGRYTHVGNKTVSTYDNLSYGGSLGGFFGTINGIHSGNFRTPPEAKDSFTYPIAINTKNLRPGCVFYSPNGHVALVAEVRKDGEIKMIDAHPDQSVTRITFGPKLEVRSRTYSGGFRGFRKSVVEGGEAVFLRDNKSQPGYSLEQYEFDDYFGEVKKRLLRIVLDPLTALETYIREDTFQEVLDRRDSIERGWAVMRHEFIAIPDNIYDAQGAWEDYSTPSRDLRLRLSMLNIPDQIRNYMRMLAEDPSRLETPYKTPRELGEALLALKERLFSELTIEYTNSKGAKAPLTLNDIEKRLFRISFDPNHAPELRWGAEGDELATALRSDDRFYAGYEKEQRWRNRLEKKQGPMSPNDDDNPRKEPRHDISNMIREMIDTETGPGATLAQAAASRPARGAKLLKFGEE